MFCYRTVRRFTPANSSKGGSARGERTRSKALRIGVECLEGRALLSHVLTQFSIEAPAGDGNDLLQAIAAGPDRSVWFLDEDAPDWFIGKISSSGKVTWFPGINDPGTESNPNGPFLLAAGPDGNMWFTTTSDIGKITPEGAITLYPASGIVGALSGLTAGPDGNVWFTSGNVVGRITPTGQITTFLIPGGAPGTQVATESIVEGRDGRLWFGALIASPAMSANRTAEVEVGAVTTTGQITLYPIEQVEQLLGGGVGFNLTQGPNGNPWLAVGGSIAPTNNSKPTIFEIEPSGQVKRFAIPLASNQLLGAIVSAPKAKVYFCVTDNNEDVGPSPQPILGALSASGKVSFKSLPQPQSSWEDGNPWAPADFSSAAPPLSVGPDRNLWYIGESQNIVRLKTY